MASKAYELSQKLLKRIHSSEWRHSQQIPSKVVLSDEYGVSQATISNALKYLRDQKVIRSIPGKGVFVVNPNDPKGPVVLRNQQRLIAIAGRYVPPSRQLNVKGAQVAAQEPIIDGLWEAAREFGCHLVLLSEMDKTIDLDLLSRLKIEGVILLGGYSLEEQLKLRHAGTVAIMANYGESPAPLNYVDYDNKTMIREMVDKCVACGHRRIAFMGHQTSIPTYTDRLQTYFIQALLHHGLVYDFLRYWKTPALESESWFDYQKTVRSLGRREAEELLSAPEPPTAIFCWQPGLLAGLEAVLAERSIRVPDQLSVMACYDATGNERYSGFVNPHVQLGRELLSHLLQNIDNPLYYVQRLLVKPYVDHGSVSKSSCDP